MNIEAAFCLSVAAAVPLYMLHYWTCSMKNNGPRAAAFLSLFLMILGGWQGYALSVLLVRDFPDITHSEQVLIAVFFFLAVNGVLIIPFYWYAGKAPPGTDI